MRYEFCTLFDKNYLVRAVTLYHSLVRTGAPFRLWMLCLDDESHALLTRMALPHVVPIAEQEFEDPELTAVKQTRSRVEYYWTITPSLILFVLTKDPSITQVAYLDADLYFYQDPAPLYEELGDGAVLIIPHRLPPYKKEKEEQVGTFNVGMLIFRNDTDGRACVQWWRQECNAWCYRTPIPGKFGDQKYLDEFPTRFQRVVISQHIGACVAPWNIRNYAVHMQDGTAFVDDRSLLFFHYSSFGVYPPGPWWLTQCPPSHYTEPTAAEPLYRNYAKALLSSLEQIRSIAPAFCAGFDQRPPLLREWGQAFIHMMQRMRRKLL